MKNKKLSAIYLAVSFAFGIAGAAWLTSLMVKYFNGATNGFSASSAEMTVLGVVLFLFVLAAFFMKFKIVGRDGDKKPMPKAVYAVVAALFLVSGVLSAVKLLSSKLNSESVLFSIFAALSTSFSFVAALIFALKTTRFEKKLQQFSLVIPFWMLLAVGSSYFNTSFTFTSFIRAILNLSMAGMIMFLMSEMREYIKRKFFLLKCASAAISIVLGTTYIVSRAIIIIIQGVSPLLSDYQEIAVLGTLVYVAFANVFRTFDIEAPEAPPAEEPPAETSPKE